MQDFKKDINNQKDRQSVALVYDPVAFKGDYDIYILYRRMENVVAALFLVTNELSDTEILKKSLRESCLKVLQGMVSFIASSKTDNQSLQILAAYVLELGSFLTMTYWSGIISEMNFTILQKEISKIRDLISKLASRHASKMVIDTTLFADVDLQMKHHQAAVAAAQSLPSLRNARDFSESPKRTSAASADPIITKNQSQQIPESSDASLAKKTERREAILALLRQQKNLSIKDFLAVVKDFSEKTIQRELLTLVEEGLIKKEGERRWSTYSLTQ